MYFFKKYFLHSVKRYISAIILGLTILLLNLWSKGSDQTINYMDGLFIAGFAILCIGGLSVLNYFGAYDFFSYAFYRKKASMDYHEFVGQKETNRKNRNIPFGPYFVVGILFILISLVLQSFYL